MKVGDTKVSKVNDDFSEKDATYIHSHNDEPMSITMRRGYKGIRRVLVD